MKIALIISALGRGGAEGQLMRLAKGLRAQGMDVEVWCYGGSSSFDNELLSLGIPVRTGKPGSQLKKILQVRTWIKEGRPDVLHAFMKRASSVAVLATVGIRKCRDEKKIRLIGSDLSTATYAPHKRSLRLALHLFRFADVVCTQTELNKRSLIGLAPWLEDKVKVIRNGLDLSRFCPAAREEVRSLEIEGRGEEAPGGVGSLFSRTERPNSELPASNSSREACLFRFAVVGTVYWIKNPVRLVQAVKQVRDQGTTEFCVDWYGRLGLRDDAPPSDEYHQSMELIQKHGLENYVSFKGASSEIENQLPEYDALLHPSVQEGFPNAVVEAMACGLPIVVSRVSDLPLVVETAKNGLCFNELDPVDIAGAISDIMKTSLADRMMMGERSRKLAEEWFGLDRFVQEYIDLYSELTHRNERDNGD